MDLPRFWIDSDGVPKLWVSTADRKDHAANAKARATQQVEAGNLSSSAASKIRAKANRILGEK